jgi:flagellar assembly factor FliW
MKNIYNLSIIIISPFLLAKYSCKMKQEIIYIYI